MNIGIIGCGLIGKRRASVIHQSPNDQLIIVADVDESRASNLAGEMNCLATTDWCDVVARDDVQAVVVSTSNKYLMPITVAALQNGKHVLVEKPMARTLAEAEEVLRAWKAENGRWKMEGGGRRSDVQLPTLRLCSGQASNLHPPTSDFRLPIVLSVGFNHRHHPAIWKAHELCRQGAIGPLMFIRAVYGHGGRPGYDKEWRADPDLAGGGELLDQGVHIVDLCRWFLGEFSEVVGLTPTYFWGTNVERSTLNVQRVEDNAFALLHTADGRVAQFHTSWTQWKNRFTFEVFGRDGYVCVEGLGGSYGVERLEVGRRRMEGGAPDMEIFEFPGPDLSWQAEWQEFTSAIREGRQPLANGEDGLQAMRLIAAIYESARTGQVVRLDDGRRRMEGGRWKLETG